MVSTFSIVIQSKQHHKCSNIHLLITYTMFWPTITAFIRWHYCNIQGNLRNRLLLNLPSYCCSITLWQPHCRPKRVMYVMNYLNVGALMVLYWLDNSRKQWLNKYNSMTLPTFTSKVYFKKILLCNKPWCLHKMWTFQKHASLSSSDSSHCVMLCYWFSNLHFNYHGLFFSSPPMNEHWGVITSQYACSLQRFMISDTEM
jgi:hypothetical protein